MADTEPDFLSAIADAARRESAVAESSPCEIDEKQQLEIDGLKTQLGNLKDIHKARLWGLVALFLLIVGWLITILTFVYWTGTPADWSKKPSDEASRMVLRLSEPVLIALIGSTTVNVIALFVIAAKWLYGPQKAAEGGAD